jgi:predicted nucleotidyltransferase
MNDDLWLKRFKSDVLPKIIESFRPKRVILFGSRIKSTAYEDSDIDVIVVSDAFINVPFVRRMSLILQTVKFPKHIDYICYSSDEFERQKNKSSLLVDALEHCEDVKL